MIDISGYEGNGSLLINWNSNGEVYLGILENATNPLITAAVGNQLERDEYLLLDEDGVHFEDGTLPHFLTHTFKQA